MLGLPKQPFYFSSHDAITFCNLSNKSHKYKTKEVTTEVIVRFTSQLL